MNSEEMGLERSGDAWRLRFEEVYATDRAGLWSAVTEPGRLARWMTAYTGDLRRGGTWEALADGDVWGTGLVTECDPPNGFTTSWTADGEAPSTLSVRLEPADRGTRLILIHDGIGSPQYGAGWAAYLGMLGEHLADPARRDLGEAGFRARFEALRADYEPRFQAVPLGA